MPPRRIDRTGVTGKGIFKVPVATGESAAVRAAREQVASGMVGGGGTAGANATAITNADAAAWVGEVRSLIDSFSVSENVQAQGAIQAEMQRLVDAYRNNPVISGSDAAAQLFPILYNLSSSANERRKVGDYNRMRTDLRTVLKRTTDEAENLAAQPARRTKLDEILAEQAEGTEQDMAARIAALQRLNTDMDGSMQQMQRDIAAKQDQLAQLQAQMESLSVRESSISDEIREAQGKIAVREQILADMRAGLNELDVRSQAVFEHARKTIDYSAFAREFIHKQTPVFLLAYFRNNYVANTNTTESFINYMNAQYESMRTTLEEQIRRAYTHPAEQTLYENAMSKLATVFEEEQGEYQDYESAVEDYHHVEAMLRHFFVSEAQVDMVDMSTKSEEVYDSIAKMLRSTDDSSRYIRAVFNLDNLSELAYARAIVARLYQMGMALPQITAAVATVTAAAADGFDTFNLATVDENVVRAAKAVRNGISDPAAVAALPVTAADRANDTLRFVLFHMSKL